MMRMGIVWRTRNVREGSIDDLVCAADDLVCAAEVSGLDGDLVDQDGRFIGRIFMETGRLPFILLTESP